MTAVALAAVGVVLIPRRAGQALLVTSAILVQPMPAFVVLVVVAAGSRWRRSMRERREDAVLRAKEGFLVDLVALGVTAGLSFDQASLAAADHVGGSAAAGMRKAVRRVRCGLSPGLASGSANAMFVAAERASESGAPLSLTLLDLARSVREEASAREHERLEKLPIKLLFPLAFLILPGFVLVAVVPTIVSGLSRLGL